jgi:hypothetical protein
MTLGEAFMKWRKERVSIEHAEHQPILDHEAPFSDEFEDWRRIKSMFQEGDELWTFCSPMEEWEGRMGWQGVVLVRDGKLVDVCISAQN